MLGEEGAELAATAMVVSLCEAPYDGRVVAHDDMTKLDVFMGKCLRQGRSVQVDLSNSR
jgi:hypothetical protein